MLLLYYNIIRVDSCQRRIYGIIPNFRFTFVLLYESAFKARKGNIAMINEEKLIKRLMEHNSRAYEQLIDGYSRLLFTVCAGILHGVGTREDVEDVVADCFCEFWQNVQRYDSERGGSKTYLCAIARSRAVDRLRLLCRRREDSLDSVFEDPSQTLTDDRLLENLISKESVLSVWMYMQSFPEPDREILTLRFFYELKPSDIAAKLSVPVTSVYERVRCGREKLRKFIAENQ